MLQEHQLESLDLTLLSSWGTGNEIDIKTNIEDILHC